MSTQKNDLYNRRDWLQLSALTTVAFCVPDILLAQSDIMYQYQLAQVKALPFELPQGKTIPFDWPVAEVPADGNTLYFTWDKNIQRENLRARLRMTSATDVREVCTLELTLTSSKQKIGDIDVRFAHYMQPFEIEIPEGVLEQVIAEGISIKMTKGKKPFWFFVSGTGTSGPPDAYLPHLLLYKAGAADHNAWKTRLMSLASLSTFGWMEGCVLDGIGMMAKSNRKAKKILNQHLDHYFANNTLVYENLNNIRTAEKISTVESILPFALLAQENPGHPMLQKAIDFCLEHADKAGVVADETGKNRTLKTEECYTISFPMAILAKMLNRPDLEKMAIVNLQARVRLLAKNGTIYQNSKELGAPAYGNWARGFGWYLLGMAKALAVLPKNDDTIALRKDLENACALAIQYQQPGGLWYCFLHQPETGTETSGSAIIAAALAYGYHKNLLPAYAKSSANKCYQALSAYYTPDGYMTGTAQVNKGGETLQRNGHRVISPYTLGFIGILESSLNSSK